MVNQLLIGAAIPYLAGLLIYFLRQGRAGLFFITLWPLSMVFGALWAIIPDIPRLLGMYDLYIRLSNDPRMDIFFWHYTIDRIEDYSPWYNALWVLIAYTLFAVILREIHRLEQNRRKL